MYLYNPNCLCLLTAFSLLLNHNAVTVSGGVTSLVQGSYDYHHYLQDGFDDSVNSFSSI